MVWYTTNKTCLGNCYARLNWFIKKRCFLSLGDFVNEFMLVQSLNRGKPGKRRINEETMTASIKLLHSINHPSINQSNALYSFHQSIPSINPLIKSNNQPFSINQSNPLFSINPFNQSITSINQPPSFHQSINSIPSINSLDWINQCP